MKHTLCIMLLLLVCVSSTAQYSRFFVPGATWTYRTFQPWNDYSWTYSFKVGNDTTIVGKTYEQIVLEQILWPDSTVNMNTPACFYRVDPASGAFYYLGINDTIEKKVFDFSLEVGETFINEANCFSPVWYNAGSATFPINNNGDEVTSYLIAETGFWEYCCGTLRLVTRIFAFDRPPDINCYQHPLFANHSIITLICYHENGQLRYLIDDNDLASLCIQTSIGIDAAPQVANPTIGFYPNPTNGFLHITHLDTTAKLQILSPDGRLLLQQAVDANNTSINLSDYVNGIYFVQLSDTNGNVIGREKIIISH